MRAISLGERHWHALGSVVLSDPCSTHGHRMWRPGAYTVPVLGESTRIHSGGKPLCGVIITIPDRLPDTMYLTWGEDTHWTRVLQGGFERGGNGRSRVIS